MNKLFANVKHYSEYYSDFWSDAYKDRIIKKYTDLGIKRDKIFLSKEPSVTIWSLSRKCLVEESVNPSDLLDELTYENNRQVNLRAYELGNPDTMKLIDIDYINNSEGIIVTGATYGREDRLRFGFIPKDDRIKEKVAETKQTKDPTIGWMKEYEKMLSETPNRIVTSSKENKIGYHLNDIPKGKLGSSSKIEEELNELKDAEKQNSKIMMMIELSDLYGAIEEYCANNGLTMEDLKIFSDITKRAFKNGKRK